MSFHKCWNLALALLYNEEAHEIDDEEDNEFETESEGESDGD